MAVLHNAKHQVAAEVTEQQKWVQAVSLNLASVTDAQKFQQLIDAELRASGKRRVLVDARQAKISSHDINDSMWSWVQTSQHFDFLAIVNQSDVLTVAAKMKARAIGTKKVKVFESFLEAVMWLGSPKPGD
jgi:hypothetical protein